MNDILTSSQLSSVEFVLPSHYQYSKITFV